MARDDAACFGMRHGAVRGSRCAICAKSVRKNPAATWSALRLLAISIFFAERSMAVMIPPSSVSHTKGRLPAPAADLQEPVVRLDASTSTAHTSRCAALGYFNTHLREGSHRWFSYR